MSQIHQHNGNCTSRNRRSEMAAMLPRNGAAAGITIKIVEPSNNEANGSNGCGGGAASPTHEQGRGGICVGSASFMNSQNRVKCFFWKKIKHAKT